MKRLRSILKSFFKYTLYLAISLLLALLIRLFVCNFYVVPSDSMEPEILPGDFILANKLTYGARIFTSLKFDRNSDPQLKRVSGFRSIRRNDVVVFNFPYRYNWDTIRMNLESIFVKRCIGLPGDSVSTVGGYYHISGIAGAVGYLPGQELMIHFYHTLDSTILRPYPFDSTLNWELKDFGPLYVPAAGTTIKLTPQNFIRYKQQMVYETDAEIRKEDTLVFINNHLATHYTFCNNWYFMAGDKAINSQDSRYIGFIPEAYIIGRASRVMTSKDPYTGKRRWNRTLKKIK